MPRKFSGLDFHQIRFHVFDDALTHRRRKQIDDGGVDRGWRGERPTFGASELHDFANVVGELLEDAAIILRLEALTLGDAVHVTPTAGLSAAVADWETAGLIRQLVLIPAMRISEIDGLHELQAWAAIRRLVHFVCLQAAAVGDDDE